MRPGGCGYPPDDASVILFAAVILMMRSQQRPKKKDLRLLVLSLMGSAHFQPAEENNSNGCHPDRR
jgi:hypothetical protein